MELDGVRLAIPASKERALITLLAAAPGAVVPSERLIGDLWGEEPPASAEVSVRVLVSRLRKTFATHEMSETLEHRDSGYALAIGPEQVDTDRFTELADKGRTQLAGGDPQLAASTLRDALALWRGPALADVRDGMWAGMEAIRLEEARFTTLENRIEADLACGRHADLLGELMGLAASHPLRERVWQMRMLALYRAGRQGEALDAHRQLRAVLAEELGISPSAETELLHQRVLEAAPSLLSAAVPVPAPAESDAEVVPVLERASARELPTGTATVMFTDVVGSTELRTRLGDATAQAILEVHAGLVRREITSHGGVEVKALGDGFMVVFASVRDALTAAVEIQRATRRRSLAMPAESLAMRIGLSAGELMREGEDMHGQAANAAARIAARAEGGEILVADVVRQLAGAAPDLVFHERGRFSLKGFPERFRLFSVEWEEPQGPAEAASLRTAFVGREAELAALRAHLDDAFRGRGSIVLIGGEPGVGKTRLAEEVAAEGASRGLLHFVGRCYDVEGGGPYAPFVEALEAGLRFSGPELFREQLGEEAADVARVMPQIRRMYSDIPPPLDLPPDVERRHLFNSLVSFIERGARRTPVALILDDLQWAEEPMLLLIQHLAPRLAEIPAIVFATYRDVELDTARPLTRTLEELLRRRLAHRISLKRLPRDHVGEMLRSLAGAEPPAALVDAIFDETEGNAFFVEELYRHLVEQGAVLDESGGFRQDLRPAELELPESIRLVIGRRLGRLGDEAVTVLAAAAVLGRRFELETLNALGGLDAQAIEDSLDRAETAGLVHPHESGDAPAYVFSHELVRSTLLGSTSLARRQRLHLAAADAIERVHATSFPDVAANVVEHLRKGGLTVDRDRMFRSLVTAGEHALEVAANEDALGFFEEALNLAPEEPGVRASVLRSLGLAQQSLDRWQESLATWKEALPLFAAADDRDGAGRTYSHIVSQLMTTGQLIDSFQITTEGLATLGDRPSPDRARLQAVYGVMLSAAGDREGGERSIREAVAAAEASGDARLLGECLARQTYVHFVLGEASASIEVGRRALDVLRGSGALWNAVELVGPIGIFMRLLGRFDGAREVEAGGEELATRLAHRGALVTLGAGRTFDALAAGDLPTLRRDAERTLELTLDERATGLGFVAHAHLGWAALYSADWEAALGHGVTMEELEPPGTLAGMGTGLRILALAHLGRRDEAVELFAASRSNLSVAGERGRFGGDNQALFAAEGLALLGEPAAADLSPVIAEIGGRIRIHPGGRLVETVAGLAAAAGGDHAAAEAHFVAAIAAADELGLPIERAEVARFYADLLEARGRDEDRALEAQLRAEAASEYRRLGMAKHTKLVTR